MPAVYGRMGGMEKTTVYLTADQKRALERAARAEGRSEARLIRDGIEAVTARHRTAEPAVPPGDGGRSDGGTTADMVARRPRWMAREEFVRRVLPHPADSALGAEIRRMTPDTTDDTEIR
jgi:hypothetical protein